MKKEIKVMNLNGTDVPLELLATDIEKLAKAGEALLNSRLTNRALHLLLQDACGKRVSLFDIAIVLNAIPALRSALKTQKQRGTK